MTRDQLNIRVLRQLESETQLISSLQKICDRFGEIIAEATGDSPKPLDMQPAEQQLDQFMILARRVTESRQKVLQQINIGNESEDQIGIRQFIRESAGPMGFEMERVRTELVRQMQEIRSQVASDSAVVFYSFDFYRRIINGLVDCIAEEQHYQPDGKSSGQNAGKLIRRVC